MSNTDLHDEILDKIANYLIQCKQTIELVSHFIDWIVKSRYAARSASILQREDVRHMIWELTDLQDRLRTARETIEVSRLMDGNIDADIVLWINSESIDTDIDMITYGMSVLTNQYRYSMINDDGVLRSPSMAYAHVVKHYLRSAELYLSKSFMLTNLSVPGRQVKVTRPEAESKLLRLCEDAFNSSAQAYARYERLVMSDSVHDSEVTLAIDSLSWSCDILASYTKKLNRKIKSSKNKQAQG